MKVSVEKDYCTRQTHVIFTLGDAEVADGRRCATPEPPTRCMVETMIYYLADLYSSSLKKNGAKHAGVTPVKVEVIDSPTLLLSGELGDESNG